MKGGVIMLGAAFAAFAASALSAKDMRNDPDSIRKLDSYAACLADRNTKGAKALLALDFRTPEYRKAMRRLLEDTPSCVRRGSRMKSGTLLIAGGLAEHLLSKDGAIASLPTLVAYNPARPDILARDRNELMSICVVREDPADVRTLLLSKIASAEEAAAIKSLTPILAKCIPSGQEMKFNIPSLRAMTALAAHRLVQHNEATGGAGAQQ